MNRNEPIFKSIYQAGWHELPPVLLKHYANRPYSKDVVTVEGVLKVYLSPFARLLAPIFRITGALVPFSGENIPVTVHFRSESDSTVYIFDRTFHFPNKKPYRFRSRIAPIGGNEAIEWMPIGIGWHACHYFNGKKTTMEHRGFKMKLFGKTISLLLEFILGKGYAEEEATGDDSFHMYMDFTSSIVWQILFLHGRFHFEGNVA